jgi:hypothetical protein
MFRSNVRATMRRTRFRTLATHTGLICCRSGRAKAQELARQVRSALGRLLNHAHGILQGIIGTQALASQTTRNPA